MILTKNYLEKLNANQILDLAQFVVTENFKHHSENVLPEDYKKDINSIKKEELNYIKNSQIFVAKDYSGSILGAIRVLRWNYTDILPIQKIFGINPLLAIHQPSINNIYHIGRFAIKKDAGDIGAGHSVTALYEIILADSKKISDKTFKYQTSVLTEDALESNDLLTLKLRYKPAKKNKSKLIEKVVKNVQTSSEEISNNFKFAAAVASFGMLLRDSENKGTTTWDSAIKLAKTAKGTDLEGYRGEMIRLMETASRMGD